MSPQARERLARLGQGLNRAAICLAQLLVWPGPKANPREDMRAESLSLLLRQILEDMMPLAEARNIDLGVLSLDEATIQTPPHALAVILKKLLDNAIRYTPPGGRVDISASCADESVILVITDTGPVSPPPSGNACLSPFTGCPAMTSPVPVWVGYSQNPDNSTRGNHPPDRRSGRPRACGSSHVFRRACALHDRQPFPRRTPTSEIPTALFFPTLLFFLYIRAFSNPMVAV